jgi:hypothetical protein
MILAPNELGKTSDDQMSIWKDLISSPSVERTDTISPPSSPMIVPLVPSSLDWQETAKGLSLGVSNLLQEIIDVLTQMRSVLSQPIAETESVDWSGLFLVIPPSKLSGTLGETISRYYRCEAREV